MNRIRYYFAFTAALLLVIPFSASAQEAKRITVVYNAFGAPSSVIALP